MQVICPISGEILLKSDRLLGYNYSEICPVFRVPRTKFLTKDLPYKFMKAASLAEKRLYFLATINCTELVTFECIARPSLEICEKNFYTIFDFAGWMDLALYTVAKNISFPRFIVREHNADMENIESWIEALQDIRNDFIKKDSDKEAVFKLNQQYHKWEKELIDAGVKNKLFTPKVVNEIFEQASMEDHPKEALYRRTMLTPLSEAPYLSPSLISEIIEVISDNFGHNHPLASTIYGQLHMLKKIAEKGEKTYEILFEDYSRIEDGQIITEKIHISEVYTDRLMKEQGSMSEPKEKDFPNRWKWIIAHNVWELAQKQPPLPPEQTIIRASLSDEQIEEEVKEHFNELDGLQDEVAESPDENETKPNEGENDEV